MSNSQEEQQGVDRIHLFTMLGVLLVGLIIWALIIWGIVALW